MQPFTDRIALQDLNVVFHVIEGLALVLALGLLLQLLINKPSEITKKFRQVLLIAFAVWGIAYLGQRGMSLYTYLDVYRPMLQGQRRQETGL